MQERTAAKKRRVKTPGDPALDQQPYSVRLQLLRDGMTENERRIGDYFLNNPNAAYLAIGEVVKESGVGYGSIIRFCQKLGCSGFQEFKILLAQEMGMMSLRSNESAQDFISEYAARTQRDIENTAKVLSAETIDAVAQAVHKARQVLLIAVSAGSHAIAQGLDYRLTRIGVRTLTAHDGYSMTYRSALLTTDDLLFAISYSGVTKDILTATRVAKSHGAAVVSLTNFLKAPLVDLADFTLLTAAAPDPLSCEIFSNTCNDFVADLLFSRICRLRPEAEDLVRETVHFNAERQM